MKRPPQSIFSPGLLPGALICSDAMIGSQLSNFGTREEDSELKEVLILALVQETR